MGIMKDPTTRIARMAVYLPFDDVRRYRVRNVSND
jgi:hypothetical protein